MTETLDAENGPPVRRVLLLAREEVRSPHAVADRPDADPDGVRLHLEERVERDDLVHLPAADVHAVGNSVGELGCDRSDLPADAAEVVEEACPLGRQLLEERGELEDVDAAILAPGTRDRDDADVRDELTDLASRLVAIDSVNPDLIPGGAGEGEISQFVAEWLEQAGLDVSRDEVAPGRWNVVGTARGTGGGRTLLLNGHLDTVGTGGMESPHEPRAADGRLYGRGAYDMKTSIAAIMLAGARAKELGLRGDVVVTAVADEEVASIGSAAVAEAVRADAAIVAEPTEERVAIAHRGFVWLTIESHGVAAHGSRPELGVDAIAKMGRVLVGLEELDRSLRAEPSHELLRSGSLHASLVEGGQELSSYPERCVLRMERRTIPGETPDEVEAEVRSLLERAGAGDDSFRADVRVDFSRAPFETPAGDQLIATVKKHAGAVLGSEPETVGVPFWTDAAIFMEAGIPTVVFGPCGEGAHAVVEWVDLASAARCAEIYVAVAADVCA